MHDVPLGAGTPALQLMVLILVVAAAAWYAYRRFCGRRRSPCADCATASTCPAAQAMRPGCGCDSHKA